MNIATLKARFSDRAIERSGCWLLRADDALALVDDISRAGIKLCGIEGYWLKDGMLQPSAENSLYFIGTDVRLQSQPGRNSVEKARSFLEQRRTSELLFDFDLEERP